ncbi:MAG: hypothetical protein AAF802_18630 [Planctomycetota bacterium]
MILVTAIALVLAIRTNERYNIQRAIDQVELNGGYVLYHWESPVVNDQDFTVSLALQNAPEQQVNVVVTKFSFGPDDQPAGTNPLSFLVGAHRDIDIHTVVVEADNINEDLIDSLCHLKNLRSVRWVFNVQKVSEKERLRKVRCLEERLPHVEVRFAANYNLDDR